jgi:hypothetical protein
VLLEQTFDSLDSPFDPGAVPARRGEKNPLDHYSTVARVRESRVKEVPEMRNISGNKKERARRSGGLHGGPFRLLTAGLARLRPAVRIAQ